MEVAMPVRPREAPPIASCKAFLPAQTLVPSPWLEAAEKGSTGSRQTSYRKIRGRLMELMADVSTLTSNINNALQVTEDIFYARIYTRYLDLLRASVWKDNIENKMLVIQRSYNLLNEEVSMYRFEYIGMSAVTLLAIILLLIIYLAVR